MCLVQYRVLLYDNSNVLDNSGYNDVHLIVHITKAYAMKCMHKMLEKTYLCLYILFSIFLTIQSKTYFLPCHRYFVLPVKKEPIFIIDDCLIVELFLIIDQSLLRFRLFIQSESLLQSQSHFTIIEQTAKCHFSFLVQNSEIY